MRFQESRINPLKDLLDLIPEEGVLLTRSTLIAVATLLNKGGIICETIEEVISCLELLAVKEYNIISIVSENGKAKLHKVNHG
jgi:hypothetical protein